MGEQAIAKARDLSDLAQAGELPMDPWGGATIVEERPVLHTVRGILEAAAMDAIQHDRSRFVSTGLATIDDRLICGLEKGTMTIVGGKTSSGKSTLTLGIVDATLRARKPALVVSLEDSERLYGKRLLAFRTGISAKALRRGELTQEDRVKIQRCVSEAELDPIYLEGRGRSVEWIVEALKSMVRHHRPELVVIDYAQKLSTQKRCPGGRKEELEYAGNMISDVCKNLDVAGLLVSQLTLEGDDQPEAGHLRDCKSLANSAENVMLLWRPSRDVETVTAGTIEAGEVACVFPKLKDGIPGIAKLYWDKERAMFRNPPNEYEQDGYYDGYDTQIGGSDG